MGTAFCHALQFSFRHHKFREATMQTNYELGKYKDTRDIQAFIPGKMDANLCAEIRQFVSAA
jgi:hypothetical protein